MGVLQTLLALLNGNGQRTVNLGDNPSQHYYSPQQLQTIRSKAPGALVSPDGQYKGIEGPLQPKYMTPQAMQQDKQQISNAEKGMVKPPNFEGATPPSMVNVSWSSKPVPYSQSLNGPPKGFGGK